MIISDKIRALLKMSNVKSKDYAAALNISNSAALNTKYVRGSFKIQDLIVLANVTGTKLAFLDEQNKPLIIFEKEDIEDDKD